MRCSECVLFSLLFDAGWTLVVCVNVLGGELSSVYEALGSCKG